MRKNGDPAWALVILLAALQPGMTVSADETTIENTTPVEMGRNPAASAEGREQAGTTPAEEKTPNRSQREERAKLEAEKQGHLSESHRGYKSSARVPQDRQCMHIPTVVMDMKSGAILYAKKSDEQHYPASITKLLDNTCCIENAELTDKVTFHRTV